jgi:nitrate/nitrite transporter NarK
MPKPASSRLFSTSFTVATTITPQYFSRKRGLATGLIFAGGGFGGAAMCFALEALIRKLGVAWAYRIQGAMTLITGIPSAWLVKERMPMQTKSFVDW